MKSEARQEQPVRAGESREESVSRRMEGSSVAVTAESWAVRRAEP